ncbi:hypothetical protein E4U42_002567 [Claviceps africana]|uniref:WW domain-containing protein n=1 Tax=Claviceps africana TaxID=83212 RepID=A0A8K0J8K2_9HYPO|nr:hypothetical protein E4U42_002567 [Claviceps africana]
MTGTASRPEVREAASPRPATPLTRETTEETGNTPEDESSADVDGASSASPSRSADKEEGEIDGRDDEDLGSAPALPAEPVPGASPGPPLPNEPVPQADDGWDCQWDPTTQAWFFHNRFTGKTQWENPRAPPPSAADAPAAPSSAPALAPASPGLDIVGGYNPAIHGDYDPNAWYAQKYAQPDEPHVVPEIPSLDDEPYVATAAFNRFTGHFQQPDAGPGRHTDEAKSTRHMHAFFDVDAVANADDGRSLKAERSNKRISKSELKAFKEKRRARKEEKRRAWLRD